MTGVGRKNTEGIKYWIKNRQLNLNKQNLILFILVDVPMRSELNLHFM